MQPKHLLILSLIAILASCQKSIDPGPLPVAGFYTTADSAGGFLTMGTYDQYLLNDTSANAVSWHWDFGNDSTSDVRTPVLWYPRSGIYTLMLTVKNKAGVTSTTTRRVKVLDRYMKQLLITSFFPFWRTVGHSLEHANLYAVIRLGQQGVRYPFPTTAGQSFDAPIIYQTPVVVADSTQLPYTFTISGKQMVDIDAVMRFSTSYVAGSNYFNVGYGLELYAQDATGTYLLSSSYQFFYDAQSGSLRCPVADIRRNIFIMQYVNVQVICDYE